jgi:hypothetical protein
VHEFSTLLATTDGPPLPPACDKGFGLSFGNDIWLLYTPPSTGVATITTCDTATFDTRLAAYTGSCGSLTIVGCNDDGLGCPGFTSTLQIPVTAGVPVRVRLGGFGGATGTGTIQFTLE